MERLLIERNGAFIWQPVTPEEATIARSQGKIVKSLRQLVPVTPEPTKPGLCKSYCHEYLADIGGVMRWVQCGIEYAATRASEGKQVRYRQW